MYFVFWIPTIYYIGEFIPYTESIKDRDISDFDSFPHFLSISIEIEKNLNFSLTVNEKQNQISKKYFKFINSSELVFLQYYVDDNFTGENQWMLSLIKNAVYNVFYTRASLRI